MRKISQLERAVRKMGLCGAPSKTPAADPGDTWHADLILYLWLAGAHGTIGIASHDVDFRASPT